MTILLKAIYRFSAVPIKLSMTFFEEREQKMYKLYGNTKIAKAVLKKKNKAGRIRLHNFRLYYKATVIKVFDTGTKTEI